MEFFAFPENVEYRPKSLEADQCVSIPFTTAQQTNPHTTDLELGNNKVSRLMAFAEYKYDRVPNTYVNTPLRGFTVLS
jgi:hypothetical protein